MTIVVEFPIMPPVEVDGFGFNNRPARFLAERISAIGRLDGTMTSTTFAGAKLHRKGTAATASRFDSNDPALIPAVEQARRALLTVAGIINPREDQR